MQFTLGLSLGPLRLSLTVGEAEDDEDRYVTWEQVKADLGLGTEDEDEDEDVPAGVVGELVRLGADTTVFGFTPDPAFRDQTGWEDDE